MGCLRCSVMWNLPLQMLLLYFFFFCGYYRKWGTALSIMNKVVAIFKVVTGWLSASSFFCPLKNSFTNIHLDGLAVHMSRPEQEILEFKRNSLHYLFILGSQAAVVIIFIIALKVHGCMLFPHHHAIIDRGRGGQGSTLWFPLVACSDTAFKKYL